MRRDEQTSATRDYSQIWEGRAVVVTKNVSYDMI